MLPFVACPSVASDKTMNPKEPAMPALNQRLDLTQTRASGASKATARRVGRLVTSAWIVLGLMSFADRAISQPFRALLGAENGRIYAIQADGVLRFYWYFPENGGTSWINPSGPSI